jgi:hypothetical protein
LKKALQISGLLSAIIILLGDLLKTFHQPGAGIMIVLGGVLFSLVFLPLLIVYNFKQQIKTDRWIFSLGYLIGSSTVIGIIFKLMHWPYANAIMKWGISFFIFIYVPVYFLSGINSAGSKFNRIINSVLMLAFGGMLYSLIDLSK